ncbi:oligosaccharide flippase family protein [Chryseolinea sp. H1M3-3]|uniref:lipopolysaccharide biosynthesis protein n=1 Tax=Chryseolinea sp. H1M3-3 TaxID=3034144 RepID=UPI0023EADFC5|nr:oligosaccharide flippase family protein [Chryseolinea sp. H1M3-3]
MQKALFKNSFIYSLTTFVQKGLVFLLLPLYTRYLPPHEYGIVTVMLAISFICSAFFTFGLDSAILRFYYDAKQDAEEFKKLFGTLLIALFFISLTVFFLAVTAFSPVVQFFMDNIPFYPYAYIGFAIVVFQPLYNLCLAFLQAKHQASGYSFLSFMYFIINIGFMVFFVVILQMGAIGYLLSILIAQVLSSVAGLWILRDEFLFKFQLQFLNAAMKYSMPLIPHSVASQAAGYADRILLNKFMNSGMAGIYHLGYVLSMPIEVVTFSINRAYTPLFFKQVGENQEDLSKVVDVALVVTLIYLFFSTALALFSFEIVSWFFSENFLPAYKVIPFISFSFANTGFYYLFSTVLFYDKTLTKFVPISTIIAAITIIALDLILIPEIGFLGAGIAMYTGQLTLAILSYCFSWNKIIHWPLSKILPCYLIAVAISAVGIFISSNLPSLFFSIGLKLMLLLVLLFFCSWIYYRNMLQIFKHILNVLKSLKK